MEVKANEEEQLLETPEDGEIEEAASKFDFFKKASLGIAPSIISERSSMGMGLVEMQSAMTRSLELGIKPSLLSGIPVSSLGRGLELAKFQSAMTRSLELRIKPSQLSGIPLSSLGRGLELAKFQSVVAKSLELGIKPSLLSALPISALGRGLELSKLQSAMTRSLELGIKPSQLSGIPIPSLGKGLELSKLQSTVTKAANLGIDPSLLAGVVSTYQNTILDSGLRKGEFTLSESLRIANGLTDEIQNGENSFEETSPTEYTDEQIQFIVKSLENWLNGSISLKNTLQKIKGSKWAFAFVQTVVFTTVIHLFNIFLIIDDYQIQQDRKTLESVENYLETSVLTYKLYKNIINQEKLNTFHPAGFTRTDTYLRKGKAKTAPVIPNGFVGQKTLVLMLDRKNNWRRVEVKINGTYLQGWVPESTIIQLKQNDS